MKLIEGGSSHRGRDEEESGGETSFIYEQFKNNQKNQKNQKNQSNLKPQKICQL